MAERREEEVRESALAQEGRTPGYPLRVFSRVSPDVLLLTTEHKP